jgi:hypothetical protein
MRKFFATASIAAALVIVAVSAHVNTAAAADQPTGTEEFMFLVVATRATTVQLKADGPNSERFRLVLTDMAPVTMFSDRPFRDARLMTAKALDANWDTWFAGNPPNAALTFDRRGRPPASMIVELTDSSYNATTRTLTFTAIREPREHDPMEKNLNWQRLTTPSSMRSVSLFIDLTPASSKKKEA